MGNRNYKALIVEDDPYTLRLLATILEQAGYEVELAADGAQAQAAIERNCPDFVITDWEMPGLKGVELCRRLRARAEGKYIYTILVSGRAGEESLVEGLEAGADDFLTKPLQRGILLARLKAGERVLALQSQLNELANVDPLTELLTKRAFLPQLEKEWRRAERFQSPLTCAVLDADFFKQINDTHGHPSGDKVLSAIAATLRAETRASDLVCRYGGEEFVVLMSECDEESATFWAERVRARIANQRFLFGDQTVRVTCSIGVAQRAPDIGGGEALLALADQALIVAKQSGRNRVASYSAIHRQNFGRGSAADQQLRRRLESARAGDVMTTFLASLIEDDTVEQAARHFLRSRLNAAPVVNEIGELVGIVTEKDLLGLMQRPLNWSLPLREIMKQHVICYELDTPVAAIHEFLCRVAIRQVIIVRQGRPVGMINQMSLLRWFTNWLATERDWRRMSTGSEREQTLAEILSSAERLADESRGFLDAVRGGQCELAPLLVASVSRMQEKMNDLLALSRHANEYAFDSFVANATAEGELERGAVAAPT